MLYMDIDRTGEALSSNESAVEELIAPLSEAELNWQPESGRAWSIGQCIDHLALSNEHYMEAMLPRISAAQAGPEPFRPTIFGAKFIEQIEPPVRRAFKAPQSIQPARGIGCSEMRRRFAHSHELIRRALEQLRSKNANSVVFRNPFIPVLRVRASTAFLILVAHERRHLWQARQVSAMLPPRS